MEGQVAQVSARFQEAYGYTAGAIADRRIQLHRAEDTLHSRTRSYDARRSELATAAGLQMCCCGLAMFLSCSCAQSCSVSRLGIWRSGLGQASTFRLRLWAERCCVSTART